MERIFNYRLQNASSMEMGAAGLVVTKGREQFILTCSHVVLAGDGKNVGGVATGSDANIRVRVIKGNSQKEIGRLYYANCSEAGDFALVKVTGNYQNFLPNGKRMGQQAIAPSNISNGDKVYFFSARQNKFVEGTLHSSSSDKSETIKYADNVEVTYLNLVKFGKDLGGGNWKTNSAKGDSGSIVYTADHKPFALLIGGDDALTFAIPLIPILEKTNTAIK